MADRLWQNLIYGKCPDCNGRLVERKRTYKCPTIGCEFFLTQSGYIKILTNPNHATIRFASPQQKEFINKALSDMGVITSEFYANENSRGSYV